MNNCDLSIKYEVDTPFNRAVNDNILRGFIKNKRGENKK